MITVKTLALYVEKMEVRIIYNGLVPIYLNSIDDWFILTIKVNKL